MGRGRDGVNVDGWYCCDLNICEVCFFFIYIIGLITDVRFQTDLNVVCLLLLLLLFI